MATPYSDTMKYLRDAPDDFTLSFKPPTSKVANNRNMLSHCEYALCRIEEYPRGPKFSVCSSCRVRRYCSREHQAADWSTHKANCRIIQEYNLDAGIYASIGVLTQTQIVQNLLQDYLRLHDSTYHQMINNTYHREYADLAADGVNLTRLTARIFLQYNPDCAENPAHAFFFEDLCIVEEDPLLWDEVMRPLMPAVLTEARHKLNTNRKNDSTFIEVLPCDYFVTDYKHPSSPWNLVGANSSHYVGIYKPEAPFKILPEWFDLMCEILASGVVLRKANVLEEKHALWIPGTLKMRGEKWVWFQITGKRAEKLPFFLPPVENWARTYTIAPFSNGETGAPMEFPAEAWLQT